MSLLAELASSFGRLNEAQQLWQSNLLPTLAVMRREEVATDTIINLVDKEGLMVGRLEAHSLVLAATSKLLSDLLLASTWSATGAAAYSVTLAGRDLVEAEQVLDGVYRGEEGEAGRLRSWLKGEEGHQPVFEGKATAFKSLELEILGEILGGKRDEHIGTKRERGVESQGKVMRIGNQRIQPSNLSQLLCPVVGCDLSFPSKEEMRHHLKTTHSKSNENLGVIKTITKIDDILDVKVNKLQEIFLPVKNHEEVVKIAQIDFDSHRVQTSAWKNLLCPELGCTGQFAHRQGLRAHIKNVHHKSLQATVEQQYPINNCDEVLKSTDQLEDHVNSNSFQQKQVQRLKCSYPDCSIEFANRAMLLKHLKIDHVNDQIDCKVCGTSYKDVYYLKKHTARKHSSQEFQCDQCEYRTSVMEDLKKHMNSKHDPTRYPCEFCGKDFSTGRGLDVHMIQKHGKEHKGQELICSQCDYKVIGQPSKLEVHIEMKHNSLRFTCVHCELVSVNSQTLDAHMSSNHEAEQIKENNIVKSSEWKRREREATKEHPCKDCGQIFKKRGGLRNHRITQHLKSSFSCPKEGCEFKTKHKALVKHHQEIKHLGLFKYCDMCDFRGRTKTRVDSHKINKHKVTPIVFSCNKCETKHSNQDKMRKHMLSMH